MPVSSGFTLRQLSYLVAVGELGSVARAAERVHVSAPSVSAAITQIEARFGVPLFVRRHAHGLTPTPAGRQVLVQARAVLEEARRLDALAEKIAGQVRGPLDVGCLSTFAQIVLPRVRRSFVAQFPEVAVRQSERDQQALIAALRAAEIDVALTYDLEVPPDLAFEPLHDLPPYALLPAGHALVGRARVSPAELAPHPMVLLDLPHSGPYFLSIFAEAGISPQIAERTHDMEVMKSLVANGFGYSIANIRPTSDRAADGRRLVFVPLDGPARPMRMGLMRPRAAHVGATLRAFIDHCRAHLPPDGAGPPSLS
ncbi:LysR family transcriptional regulator [Mesobaculum littorinae]|uniref:LysR family transcriptional regulator n=1 Tax=Mesobaculum littorinae TaxID=2486419 RepID=A0A438AD69_9RHOB|nr:LysR family transcriptional regulator [Mesobaculum littorinae]